MHHSCVYREMCMKILWRVVTFFEGGRIYRAPPVYAPLIAMLLMENFKHTSKNVQGFHPMNLMKNVSLIT